MKDEIRILDKSKKSNKRCGSCMYGKKYKTEVGLIARRCTCQYSNNRFKDVHYWNMCKYFTWDENIVDKNEV